MFIYRGGSSVAAIPKIERFVIIVNGFHPLAIITKRSILDVAAALDPPLICHIFYSSTLYDKSQNQLEGHHSGILLHCPKFFSL